MKKLILLTFLFCACLLGAQNTMYIMKGGSVIEGGIYDLSTVDSLTFSAPTTTPISVTGVTIGPATASLVSGETQQLTATISPSGATNQSVTWGSSNNEIASVSTSGLVTAGTTAGTATITATAVDTANGTIISNPSSITVTTVVTPPPSGCLNTNGDFASASGWEGWYSDMILDNATLNATASFDFTGGEAAITNIAGASAYWEVSIVTNAPFVQGKTYEISFDARSTTTKSIKVSARKGSGDFPTYSGEVEKTLTATMQPYSMTFTHTAATDNTAQVLFLLSSTTDPVYIDNVCVKETTIPVASVSVSPAMTTLGFNGTRQLSATVSPVNATNQTVTWLSDNPGVASVDLNTGLVTAGTTEGTATITATAVDNANGTIISNPSLITVTTVAPTSDVRFYDLTGKQFGKVGTVTGTVATGYSTGATSQYQYQYTSIEAGGLVGFDVILPPSYATSPNKKYPVIYHLHGHGQTASAWSYDGDFQVNLPAWWGNSSIGEFILVSVGGPAKCWWSDGNNGVKAESHIINEVLSVVDQKFQTLGTRTGRAITGFSMGGFGASKIAIKYPEYFAAAATFCGATFDGNRAGTAQGFWFDTPNNQPDFDLIWGSESAYQTRDCGRALLPSKATSIIAEGTKFVIRAATSDTFLAHNKSFRDELQAEGVTVNYIEKAGTHTMDPVTPDYFNAILAYLAPAQ